jgi:hypothetical protein
MSLTTIDKLKQSVKKAVTRHYPNEIQLLEAIPEKAWEEYRQAIKSYKGGQDCASGWGLTIIHWMTETGVDQRTAYILSDIRRDIEIDD